jgi:hypothetical protein
VFMLATNSPGVKFSCRTFRKSIFSCDHLIGALLITATSYGACSIGTMSPGAY